VLSGRPPPYPRDSARLVKGFSLVAKLFCVRLTEEPSAIERTSAVGGAWRGAALNRASLGRPALWHEGFNGGPRHVWRGGISSYREAPDYAPSWGYGPWFGVGPWGWDSWGGYTRTSEYDIDACWIRDPDTGGWMRRCY
jgi:hypothetical protein